MRWHRWWLLILHWTSWWLLIWTSWWCWALRWRSSCITHCYIIIIKPRRSSQHGLNLFAQRLISSQRTICHNLCAKQLHLILIQVLLLGCCTKCQQLWIPVRNSSVEIWLKYFIKLGPRQRADTCIDFFLPWIFLKTFLFHGIDGSLQCIKIFLTRQNTTILSRSKWWSLNLIACKNDGSDWISIITTDFFSLNFTYEYILNSKISRN